MAEPKETGLLSWLPLKLQELIKAGAVIAALFAVWIFIANPMREDFRDFKDTMRTEVQGVRTEVQGVRGDVRNLTENIVASIRDRLGRLEERVIRAERDVARNQALLDDVRNGKK